MRGSAGVHASEALLAFAKAMRHAARVRIAERTRLTDWMALDTYLRVEHAFERIEHVRVLYLSARNALLLDEIMSRGTIDRAELHVREVITRALEVGAAGLILVHNHPGGESSPSRADIDTTRAIVDAAKLFQIGVHDHLIVSASGTASLRARGLI